MKNILFVAFIILIGCQSTQKINLAIDLKQNAITKALLRNIGYSIDFIK